jgi:two-component system, NarL family, invasion response regulator UvrY
MTRILLADNQSLTASGLIHLFEKTEGIHFVGLVRFKNEFISLLTHHQPDLLVADHNLPSYISGKDLAAVKENSPATKILIISSDNDRNNILDLLKIGAKGYLTKDCSQEEILTAIQKVGSGEKFFCQSILDVIIEGSIDRQPEVVKPKGLLSAREMELLALLAKGYSTQRAAEAMNLSPHTIHTHRKKIIKKLGIKSPTQYVLAAMELGLLKTL